MQNWRQKLASLVALQMKTQFQETLKIWRQIIFYKWQTSMTWLYTLSKDMLSCINDLKLLVRPFCSINHTHVTCNVSPIGQNVNCSLSILFSYFVVNHSKTRFHTHLNLVKTQKAPEWFVFDWCAFFLSLFHTCFHSGFL